MSEMPKEWTCVERFTYAPKPMREDEVVAVLQEISEQYPAPHGWRILRCKFGAGSRVEMEIEWQGGWDEHQKVWMAWQAQAGGETYMTRLSELLVSESIREWLEPPQ